MANIAELSGIRDASEEERLYVKNCLQNILNLDKKADALSFFLWIFGVIVLGSLTKLTISVVQIDAKNPIGYILLLICLLGIFGLVKIIFMGNGKEQTNKINAKLNQFKFQVMNAQMEYLPSMPDSPSFNCHIKDKNGVYLQMEYNNRRIKKAVPYLGKPDTKNCLYAFVCDEETEHIVVLDVAIPIYSNSDRFCQRLSRG